MSMTIAFSCPKCRTKIEVPSALAGRSGKCKGCGGPIKIPSPRAAASSRPVPPTEEPLVLDAFDDAEADEPSPAFDEDLVAPAPPRVERAAVKKANTPRRRARPERSGEHVVTVALLGPIAGALGVISAAIGLLLLEVMTMGVLRFPERVFGTPIGYLLIALDLAALAGGALGLARLLQFLRLDGSKEAFEGAKGTSVAIVGLLSLLMVGQRLVRGVTPPALMMSVIAYVDRSWDPNRGMPPARNFENEARQTEEVRRLVGELSAPELNRRIAGARALAAIWPSPVDPSDMVRNFLFQLTADGGKEGTIAAIYALGRWGERGYLEAQLQNSDREIAQAAREALDAPRPRH